MKKGRVIFVSALMLGLVIGIFIATGLNLAPLIEAQQKSMILKKDSV